MDPETRQRLLELVYDLLPEAEAAELRQRIAADPELARAYAEAQRTAQLLADAARLPAPRIEWKRPAPAEKPVSTPSEPPVVRPAAPRPRKPAVPLARGANWTVGIGAAALLVISLGGYWYHREQLAGIAAEHLRLVVTGPSQLTAGARAAFEIDTLAVTGEPMPAQVEFAVYAPDGKVLLKHNENSDEHGWLEVVVPSDLNVPHGSRLKVVAVRDDKAEEVDTRLAVDPVRYATHLVLDKPLYQPGETIYYRSLTLSRFALAADRDVKIHFEILDPSGAVVPDSQSEGMTQRGVGNGAFAIPEQLAGGQYQFVARSLDGSFPEERKTFFVRRYRLPRLKKELEFARDSYAPGGTVVADFLAERAEGGPAAGAKLQITATVDDQNVFDQAVQAGDNGSYQIKFKLPEKIQRGDGQLAVVVDDGGTRETIAKTIPINLGKVEVKFYPEGGDLVPDLENRVYFTSRNPLGKPAHVRGMIVDEQGEELASAETAHEGMGSFTFTPRLGKSYRLRIESPAGVKDEPRLPEVARGQKVVLNSGSGVFAPDAPLEFGLRASKEGIPLVVSAWCRGVQVGHEWLVTSLQDEKGNSTEFNPVAIPLADSVGGVIRLTVHDYSVHPPRPVAERLVYRRPGRRLVVNVGEMPQYAPGQPVELSLAVADENGQAVPATLGLAVTDDALLSLAEDHSPSMSAHFLLTTEVEKPEDLENANFYLGDGPEAAAALDLLLGTQGWRRFVEKTLPELKDRPQREQLERLVAMGGTAAPPTMFDNLGKIRAQYEGTLNEYHAHRTRALNTLTTVSFFGGLALVLLVALLGLLGIVSGLRLWIPALGATLCSLIIGAILMDPSRLASGPDVAVAFQPFSVSVPWNAEDKPLDGQRPAELQYFAYGVGDKTERGEEGLRLARSWADAFGVQNLKCAQNVFGWRYLGRDRDLPNAPVPGPPRRLVENAGGQRGGEGASNDGDRRFAIREYAHKHVAGASDVRSDFTETLYWHPMLVAGADGKATARFELSDAVTTFRVRVDAHGSSRIGSGTAKIISRIPFNLEPKLPLEVTAGDRIDLPLAVVNDTQQPLPVGLRLDHGDHVKLEGAAERKLELGAGQRGREYFTLNVTGEKGRAGLTFHGTAGSLADAVQRPLIVVPPGFPRARSYSGRIDGPQQLNVELPEQWIPGSLEVTLSAFPSTLASLQKGLDGILQEPSGCFEQASTSNYPNVLSLQYMQENDLANPQITRRSKDLLDKGYAKLVGYECKEKGYEWFGGDPGHEALTAYGLMQFRDMAQVYHVDAAMIHRTADWLLKRRDGKGGFQRNPKALDSFGGAPQAITNAYIVWALSESGEEGIEAEVKHAVALATGSDDPYLVALAASAALNTGNKDDGRLLLEKLAKVQPANGRLEGKQGSITRSGGLSLAVETTALAAVAWLKLPEYHQQAGRAIQWIIENRQPGGAFGSTQATILALKALIQHAKANRRTAAGGKLILKRDDAVLGQREFVAGRQETVAIEGLEAKLQSGVNKLTVELTGDNEMPYALDVRYSTHKPESSEACPLRLHAELAARQLKAGQTVALKAELVNTRDQGQPMTVAILGLPAGLEPRHDQLEELKKAGTIDYFETKAREIIFYWRSLAPKKKISLKLDLMAAVPGKYSGPASRTYLYYTAEEKQWADPLEVEIAP